MARMTKVQMEINRLYHEKSIMLDRRFEASQNRKNKAQAIADSLVKGHTITRKELDEYKALQKLHIEACNDYTIAESNHKAYCEEKLG